MIFYYSGTGNSSWAAEELAAALGVETISIADQMKQGSLLRYQLQPEEPLGFVFPVYAWNPPARVLEFIQKMEIQGYTDQFTFALCTCGDNTGNTMKVIESRLKQKKFPLNAAWSIIMPNNYLPMGDVDCQEVEARKQREAEDSLNIFIERVKSRQTGENQIPEHFRGFKTNIIGYFFNRFGRTAKPFYCLPSCISCGLCEQICPASAISFREGKPVWAARCDQCYGCLHRCPVQAIQYGKGTEQKGRYCHPSFKAER